MPDKNKKVSIFLRTLSISYLILLSCDLCSSGGGYITAMQVGRVCWNLVIVQRCYHDQGIWLIQDLLHLPCLVVLAETAELSDKTDRGARRGTFAEKGKFPNSPLWFVTVSLFVLCPEAWYWWMFPSYSGWYSYNFHGSSILLLYSVMFFCK